MNKNHLQNQLKSTSTTTNSLLIFRPWDSTATAENSKITKNSKDTKSNLQLDVQKNSSGISNPKNKLESRESNPQQIRNDQMLKGYLNDFSVTKPINFPEHISHRHPHHHQELFAIFQQQTTTAINNQLNSSMKNVPLFTNAFSNGTYPFSEYFLERCFQHPSTTNVRSMNPLNFSPSLFVNYMPNNPNEAPNMSQNLMVSSSKTIGVDFEDPMVKMIKSDHKQQLGLTTTSMPNNNKKQRPKKFQCPHCQVSFSNNGQLKGHIRIHTGERPFICDHQNCGKTFTRNEELTRHKRIHTGLRPFGCSICNKSFGRKDHLKKHVKTHQRPPPMPITLASTLAAAAAYPPFSYPWI